MTTTVPPFDIYRGEDVNITVSVTGVTLTGTNTVEAHFRNKQTNVLALAVPGVVTANGPPAALTFALTDTQTELLTATPHMFSVWRIDDGSETPYAVGSVTVRNTARTGT